MRDEEEGKGGDGFRFGGGMSMDSCDMLDHKTEFDEDVFTFCKYFSTW